MNRRKFLAAAAIAAVTGNAAAKGAETEPLGMERIGNVINIPSRSMTKISDIPQPPVHATMPPGYKLLTDGVEFKFVYTIVSA
jgi:hypothetical protein